MDLDVLTHREFQLGALHVMGGDLGHVHQAFDSIGHRNKRPKRDRLGDLAVHYRPHTVRISE